MHFLPFLCFGIWWNRMKSNFDVKKISLEYNCQFEWSLFDGCVSSAQFHIHCHGVWRFLVILWRSIVARNCYMLLCFRLIYIQLLLLTFHYFGWKKYKLPVNIHETLNEKWCDRIAVDSGSKWLNWWRGSHQRVLLQNTLDQIMKILRNDWSRLFPRRISM